MVEGRCMKCRKQVEIKDGKEVTMKNGMLAMKGTCGACGTKVFRILGKKKK
jgi:DNA-directed RNA polymerase subunit RPC12/RpoP